MKKALRAVSLMVAAFGVGVFLSILFSAEWMLMITVIVLIVLSVCGSSV